MSRTRGRAQTLWSKSLGSSRPLVDRLDLTDSTVPSRRSNLSPKRSRRWSTTCSPRPTGFSLRTSTMSSSRTSTLGAETSRPRSCRLSSTSRGSRRRSRPSGTVTASSSTSSPPSSCTEGTPRSVTVSCAYCRSALCSFSLVTYSVLLLFSARLPVPAQPAVRSRELVQVQRLVRHQGSCQVCPLRNLLCPV